MKVLIATIGVFLIGTAYLVWSGHPMSTRAAAGPFVIVRDSDFQASPETNAIIRTANKEFLVQGDEAGRLGVVANSGENCWLRLGLCTSSEKYRPSIELEFDVESHTTRSDAQALVLLRLVCWKLTDASPNPHFACPHNDKLLVGFLENHNASNVYAGNLTETETSQHLRAHNLEADAALSGVLLHVDMASEGQGVSFTFSLDFEESHLGASERLVVHVIQATAKRGPELRPVTVLGGRACFTFHGKLPVGDTLLALGSSKTRIETSRTAWTPSTSPAVTVAQFEYGPGPPPEWQADSRDAKLWFGSEERVYFEAESEDLTEAISVQLGGIVEVAPGDKLSLMNSVRFEGHPSLRGSAEGAGEFAAGESLRIEHELGRNTYSAKSDGLRFSTWEHIGVRTQHWVSRSSYSMLKDLGADQPAIEEVDARISTASVSWFGPSVVTVSK